MLINFLLQSLSGLLPTTVACASVDTPENRDFAPDAKENHTELKELTKPY